MRTPINVLPQYYIDVTSKRHLAGTRPPNDYTRVMTQRPTHVGVSDLTGKNVADVRSDKVYSFDLSADVTGQMSSRSTYLPTVLQ